MRGKVRLSETSTYEDHKVYEGQGSYTYSGKSGRDPTPYSGVKILPSFPSSCKCNVPTLFLEEVLMDRYKVPSKYTRKIFKRFFLKKIYS